MIISSNNEIFGERPSPLVRIVHFIPGNPDIDKTFFSWIYRTDVMIPNMYILLFPIGTEKVVPFGRKPQYVAVPDRGPGTGTNYEKSKRNTTFRSEIPTEKTSPPF